MTKIAMCGKSEDHCCYIVRLKNLQYGLVGFTGQLTFKGNLRNIIEIARAALLDVKIIKN